MSDEGGRPDALWQRAYIALGANLGQARQALEQAVHEVSAIPETSLVAVSGLYRSAPVDAGGPDYLNAVVLVRTALNAPCLLAELHRIEARFGRTRTYRNAPRTLDLDLLVHAGLPESADPALCLPHPRMHERAFVLRPLLDIEPNFELPHRGPARQLLLQLGHQSIDQLAAHWCGPPQQPESPR